MSCRALLSAFSSALLFVGLSAGTEVSEAGTGTVAGAGTAEGAEGNTVNVEIRVKSIKRNRNPLAPHMLQYCSATYLENFHTNVH